MSDYTMADGRMQPEANDSGSTTAVVYNNMPWLQ